MINPPQCQPENFLLFFIPCQKEKSGTPANGSRVSSYIRMCKALVDSLLHYYLTDNKGKDSRKIGIIVAYLKDNNDTEKDLKEVFRDEKYIGKVLLKNYCEKMDYILPLSAQDNEDKYIESENGWANVVWTKLEAFDEKILSEASKHFGVETHLCNLIVSLDVDLIIYNKIDESIITKLSESKNHFIAAPYDDDTLGGQFKADFPLSDLFRTQINNRALNAGVTIVKPNESIYRELKNLATKYHRYCRFPEQGILNLYFSKHSGWMRSEEYTQNGCINELAILPFDKEILSITEEPKFSFVHFCTPRPKEMGNVSRDGEATLDERKIQFRMKYHKPFPQQELMSRFKAFC